MKKLGVFVFLSLLLVSSLVSAQSPGVMNSVANLFTSFYDTIVDPFAKFLLGDTVGGKPELFFAKVLIFLLLASLVGYAANQFPPTQGPTKSILISVIVSALAVRFLTASWVEAIVLPYTVFGIAVSVIIPLALFFFFVETGLSGQPTLRKVSWIIAAVVFLALYFSRYDSPFIGTSDASFNPGHIYFYAALASIALLFFDNTIQRAFKRARYSDLNEAVNVSIMAQLRREYRDVQNELVNDSITADESRRLIADIKRRARANRIDPGLFP